MVGGFPRTFSLKFYKHGKEQRSIGATVDKLGVDEGGVEHLVFLRENLITWYPTCR